MENEKSNQSIINGAFVAAGFLVYLLVNILFETFAGSFGAVARLRNIDVLKHGLPVGLALITMLVLFITPKTRLWADEAVIEVRKVVWPTRKDVTAMTLVCCVMVVLAGLGFGVFDFLSSRVIALIVK
jgi:preprotein translocase subunit SecE